MNLSRHLRRCLLSSVALAALLHGGCALPHAQDAAQGGFSKAGLERVTEAMQAAVDRGDVGGVVTLLFRHGEVAQVNALGWQDPVNRVPMARDSIFRIAPMTKPITAVATLILLDEGHFELDDPVDRWARPN